MKKMNTLLVAMTMALGLTNGAWAWDAWDGFKASHVQNGRVIDHSDKRSITTSEGQSYAMFFALVADDQETFDALYRWTDKNLTVGGVSKMLPAWLWGKDTQRQRTTWRVLDANNAVDSDMWIAYCLLEAGRLWKRDDYTEAGVAMMGLLKKHVRHIRNLGDVLLPGARGFEKKDGVTLNPSYYPLFILKRFADIDPSWQSVVEGSLRTILRSAPDGFAPDWVKFDYYGNLLMTDDSVGSYNAIRVYLWSSMLSQRDPSYSLLKRHFRNMINATDRLHMPPEVVDLRTLKINGVGPDGFGACLLHYLGNTRTAALIRTVLKQRPIDKDSYYSNALTLFALGFDQKLFAFDPQGRLVLE